MSTFNSKKPISFSWIKGKFEEKKTAHYNDLKNALTKVSLNVYHF